ncbi:MULTISPECIES: M56 family metallopeptidase [unclassified Streptomyces]|uniref:M56 family metallopeptidase n=1 Tax=unclassified Streptomyces TaxID=2593676 RepID=UPI0011CA755A|nr:MULTISPECIES: M56 family metallopeptidase [unclassified Streptomyces]TXS17137.1 M56 family peptidase [Streptomyces sp. wa22]WSQ78871.1 M56 family metallopeptidase [Streptomyces sp. NBC_01213]WSQ86240.1 M56 family metallopeptidase [Streptomyces sp. NBC_01212]WSR07678.1 M56 family metallopeptidase [Streptomyces sp. NBC_01208]
MGVFVYLPLVLPLTALPMARLAEQHLHPRSATRLLAVTGSTLALCSTLCLALLMVVGTAQLPGNPLPDGWSDPEVRAAVPYEEKAGLIAIGVLGAVLAACGSTLLRHTRARIRAAHALRPTAGSGDTGDLAVIPSPDPFAYALPGGRGRGHVGQVVVSTAMMECLDPHERRALVAHERAHLTGGHHHYLLATQLAARANPFLLPLRTAVAYSTERWADEEAAYAVGSRRAVATAVGKAALFANREPGPAVLPGFAAAAGPVPRRVAALLDPEPSAGLWPPASAHLAVAAVTATVGTAVSALSSLNATVTLVGILHAATPL